MYSADSLHNSIKNRSGAHVVGFRVARDTHIDQVNFTRSNKPTWKRIRYKTIVHIQQ